MTASSALSRARWASTRSLTAARTRPSCSRTPGRSPSLPPLGGAPDAPSPPGGDPPLTRARRGWALSGRRRAGIRARLGGRAGIHRRRVRLGRRRSVRDVVDRHRVIGRCRGRSVTALRALGWRRIWAFVGQREPRRLSSRGPKDSSVARSRLRCRRSPVWSAMPRHLGRRQALRPRSQLASRSPPSDSRTAVSKKP